MGKAADLAAKLDASGFAIPAPREHPVHGVSERRWIAPARIAAAAELANGAGFFYESMTCVDRLEAHNGFELIYTFNRYDEPARIALQVLAPKDSSVPSLTGVYPMASWNEREAWEFYGLVFDGHPNLTWLLLPEDTDFHPLLKSFSAPPPSIYDDSMNPAVTPAVNGHSHTDPRD
ncbi:MAG TPA: NADH-quinone oxidoreductase subunit C [Gemmatimonadales bacterium]